MAAHNHLHLLNVFLSLQIQIRRLPKPVIAMVGQFASSDVSKFPALACDVDLPFFFSYFEVLLVLISSYSPNVKGLWASANLKHRIWILKSISMDSMRQLPLKSFPCS